MDARHGDTGARHPQDAPERPDDFPTAMAAIRTADEETMDLAGDAELAAFSRLKTGDLAAVTWDKVQEETWVDSGMRDLITAIGKGFNESVLERLPAGWPATGGTDTASTWLTAQL